MSELEVRSGLVEESPGYVEVLEMFTTRVLVGLFVVNCDWYVVDWLVV